MARSSVLLLRYAAYYRFGDKFEVDFWASPELGVPLFQHCVLFAAFIVVGDIGKVFAVEDRRLAISQSQYFIVHFALVLLACTLVSFVTPFGFGLPRTYVMWSFLFLFISFSISRFHDRVVHECTASDALFVVDVLAANEILVLLQLENRRPPRNW